MDLSEWFMNNIVFLTMKNVWHKLQCPQCTFLPWLVPKSNLIYSGLVRMPSRGHVPTCEWSVVTMIEMMMILRYEILIGCIILFLSVFMNRMLHIPKMITFFLPGSINNVAIGYMSSTSNRSSQSPVQSHICLHTGVCLTHWPLGNFN